ncbi:MAG: DUF5407 family protein, partial [Waddliaceae bacterium]|nr:DUF5407 family protein [Waddliaceae bacterium]
MAETFTSKSTKDQIGFVLEDITGMITGAMSEAKAKLQTIKSAGSSVSIGNMFDMQLLMNRLAQFSEMS